MSSLLISGLKPTSLPHIGNYIGALAQWKRLQHDYRCLFFIADLHAVTVPQPPQELRDHTREVVATYLGVGLDPTIASFFLQSEVSAHSELAWLLCTIARLGEMERMTQYKDKAQKEGREGIGMGLLSYPILMSADILLYDAEFVPVGEDQVQHIELARDLAKRFNERFGETFCLPKPLIQPQGARVMSLTDPLKKMSKSDINTSGTLFLTDTNDVLEKKIMRAVTDTDGVVRFEKATKPAVSNLLTIFHAMTGEPIEALEAQFAGQGYGTFKTRLAEAVIAHLTPIRERILALRQDPSPIDEALNRGRKEANTIASAKIALVRERMGLGR